MLNFVLLCIASCCLLLQGVDFYCDALNHVILCCVVLCLIGIFIAQYYLLGVLLVLVFSYISYIFILACQCSDLDISISSC